MAARNLQRSIERVQQRVTRAVFADAFLRASAIALFALAAVALTARVAFEWERARAAWFFSGLVLAPVVAWWIARRKRWSASAAAAWLDVQSGATGALVTGFERVDDAWHERVDAALARAERLPRARIGRPLALAVAGLSFAVLALWVAIPRVVPGPSRTLQTAAIERTQEKLATLEEQVTLDPVTAQELHETLERLKEGSEGETIESTFESLDRAGERIEDEARARVEEAQSAQDALAAAEAAANADPEAAQKQLEATMAALSKAGLAKDVADELAKQGLQLPAGAKGLELPPGTKLDAAQIAKLSDALRGQLGEKLAKLAAAGLLKEGTFPKDGKPGEIAEHVCTAECKKNPGGT